MCLFNHLLNNIPKLNSFFILLCRFTLLVYLTVIGCSYCLFVNFINLNLISVLDFNYCFLNIFYFSIFYLLYIYYMCFTLIFVCRIRSIVGMTSRCKSQSNYVYANQVRFLYILSRITI